MAFAALPPELRSLCRRLTSTEAEQLPALLPSLLKDLLRCQEPLSKPQEAKASESSSESAVLVHKLKTRISALLGSRTTRGRFVGIALVKATVETGGWECFRTSKQWVQGLLSNLQVSVSHPVILVRLLTGNREKTLRLSKICVL